MSLPRSLPEFEASLERNKPLQLWPITLQALWWDARGDWEAAHDLVDQEGVPMGSWVHAYLHRKEGDEWNAGYWYRQAGKPFCELSLADEWQQLVTFFITEK